MIWQKIKIETNALNTDLVASVLFENGIEGIEIKDNILLTDDEIKKMYVDIFEENKNKSQNADIIFYVAIVDKKPKIKKFSKNVDSSYMFINNNIYFKDEYDNLLKNIKKDLKNISSIKKIKFKIENVDDKNFTAWKTTFKNINIDDVKILPIWKKTKNNSSKNIFIDPGSAFGTGQHETTKLCIKFINNFVKNNKTLKNIRFIDIGTGSGILSIVAYKKNIKNIVAIDVDKNVKQNLLTNLSINNILASKISYKNNNIFIPCFKYCFGNLLTNNKLKKYIFSVNYDVVIINIIAPIIKLFIKKLKIYNYINNGGYFVCSGIVDEAKEEINNVILETKCLKIQKINHIGEWYSFVCQKVGHNE